MTDCMLVLIGMKIGTHARNRSSFYIWNLASLLTVAFPWPVGAWPGYGSDCANCHSNSRTGMYLTSYQTTTNLGSGVLKVYQVTAGQALPIAIQVTNNWGGNYGLAINNLQGSGFSNSTHHLVYTPDATWANQFTYFTVGPTATSPKLWIFNLTVETNTPPDFYPVELVMAGLTGPSGSPRWHQAESVYIQVVAPLLPPPPPTMMTAQRSGNSFSAAVVTTTGFTYYLEYKTSLTGGGTWTVAAQAAGDGAIRTLTDTGAADASRFYRVRVQ